jgi:two-component system, chemotaxis family, chemotaxis protein CheY
MSFFWGGPSQEESWMSKKIIVIDDSQTVRQQVALALTQGGYTVIEAVDGLDGFNVIQKTPDVDLVICDVNMPRVNGLEMLENLKTAGRTVSVVMLTTEGQPQMVERAKKAGARGWIIKPFKPDLLLSAARKICGG